MSTSTHQQLESLAKKIHDYLRTEERYDPEFIPPPFFIEFTGPASSGKSTSIRELYNFLRRHGFRVLKPQEGAEVIQHIPRTTPLYNIRTGMYALTQLIDLAQGHMYDVVLFDRCVYDAHTWMSYWREKQLLTEEECRHYQTYFLSPFWQKEITIGYIMVCDPEIAARRELRIALSDKLGDSTKPASIAKIHAHFVNTYETLKDTHPQLQLIDTSRLTESQMVETIGTRTLEILEQKIRERARSVE